VGLWSSKRRGDELEIAVEPFGELDPAWREPLAAEAGDLARFEDATVRVREPTG
jgi:hypothetical protein